MDMDSNSAGVPGNLHQADDAPRDALRRLEIVIEHVADGILAIDAHWNLLLVNAAARKMISLAGLVQVGRLEPQLVNQFDVRDIHDEPVPFDRWPISRALRGETVLHERYSVRHRPTGSKWIGDCSAAPVTDQLGQVVQAVVTIHDVTKLIRAEDTLRQGERLYQLAHAGRMSVMGELAASLAHELNQPLQAIANYAGGLLLQFQRAGALSDNALPVLERIAAEGNRAAEIIRRLRAFVRRREPRRSTFSLPAAIGDAIALIEPDARRRHIALEFIDRLGDCAVLGDSVQIEQVLLNLVRNAFDAVEQLPREHRRVVVELRSGENAIEVLVSDTGPGVPDEVQCRLFEPFFTTKPEGMGMGLAFSRSIVHAHGGSLVFRPGSAGGAIFVFTLPVQRGPLP